MDLRRYFRKMKRASKWFIRMWNSEEWDQGYLYEMIYAKLKEMNEHFQKSEWMDLEADHNAGFKKAFAKLNQLCRLIDVYEKSDLLANKAHQKFRIEMKKETEGFRIDKMKLYMYMNRKETQLERVTLKVIEKYSMFWWD